MFGKKKRKNLQKDRENGFYFELRERDTLVALDRKLKTPGGKVLIKLLFNMMYTAGVAETKLKDPDDEMLEIWFPLKSTERYDDGDVKLKALQGIVVNELLLRSMLTDEQGASNLLMRFRGGAVFSIREFGLTS